MSCTPSLFFRWDLWPKRKLCVGNDLNSNKVLDLVDRTVKYGPLNRSIIQHELTESFDVMYQQRDIVTIKMAFFRKTS